VPLLITVIGEPAQRSTPLLSGVSLVVDEEEMRPDRWLQSVLCVYFSAVTVIIGWQEGHAACRKRIPVVMVALCNRADHYIFILFLSSFFLLLFFLA